MTINGDKDRGAFDGNWSRFPNCQCDGKDLKLIEAEKTIANKDVIINMLQQQVKKLEESYKKNVNQTEEFRYKYCLANEQIKKLKTLPCKLANAEKNAEKKKDEDCNPKCRDNMPESFPHDPDQCSDKCMMNHYKMLQSLVDQILKKRGAQDYLTENENQEVKENENEEVKENENQGKKEIEDQKAKQNVNQEIKETEIESTSSNDNMESKIEKLQEDVNRLKNENLKLQEQIKEVKPEKCTCELVHRAVETDEESHEWKEPQHDIKRRISFNPEKKESIILIDSDLDLEESDSEIADCSCPTKNNTPPKTEDKRKVGLHGRSSIVSAKDSITVLQHQLIQKTSLHGNENDDLNISDVFGRESITSFHLQDSTTPDKGLVKKQSDVTVGTGIDIQMVQQKQDVQKMCSNMEEITNKITMLVEKQESTYRELEKMKEQINHTCTCATRCQEEILKVKANMEEQNNMFAKNFQENKVTTDNLTNRNDRLDEEIQEIKNKMDTLVSTLQNVKMRDYQDYEPKNIDLDEGKNESSVTVENCNNEIMNNFTACCTNENQDSNKTTNSESGSLDYNNLEEKYSELKKQKVEKDQRLKCLNELISCYNKLNEEVLCLCPPPTSQNRENRFIKEPCCDDEAPPRNEDKANAAEINKDDISICNCLTFDKNESNYSCQPCTLNNEELSKAQTSKEVQIEDIYNAVLQCTKSPTKAPCSFSPESVKSIMCCCNVDLDKYMTEDKIKRKISIEDIYEAVRSSCKQSVDKKDDCVSSASSASVGNCLLHYDLVCDKSLKPNLEAYVNYLHEQLRVISTIEDQIETLREDIKSSRQ